MNEENDILRHADAVLDQRAFATRKEAQDWLILVCGAGEYRPKNPGWNTLQAYLLKNGKRGKITWLNNAQMYLATVERSIWWENKHD